MHKGKDSILEIFYIRIHRPLLAYLSLDEHFEENFEKHHWGCFVIIHAEVKLTIKIVKST